MNMLLMSLMYPDDMIEDVARNARDGMQNQINSYQRALVKGLTECLGPGEGLDIVNCLPVGVFPTHYRRLILRSGMHQPRMQELGGLNLPWVKQRGRFRRAARALTEWAGRDGENRTVLLYTLYLPYMQAIAAAKRKYPDLRACVIVTDLPNELGISSGRRGLLKRVEYAMGDQRIELCKAFDGFVLLTQAMAEALPIEGKRQMVLEGLIEDAPEPPAESADGRKPAVLYTGTLNRELGIGELLEAFGRMPEYELWLCGRGDMEREAQLASRRYAHIHYFGFVPQAESLRLQARASLLINPRSPMGVYTRYSFPSKTLEYMRSGKPVLCYRLEGIPQEYDPFLYYIKREGAEGICEAVRETLSLSSSVLAERGQAARRYVLEQKNPKVQCGRVIRFLRKL